MKNIHFETIIAVSVIFLFFAACSSKEHSSVSLAELIQAETVMYEYPDSALHILQNMKMPDAAQKLEHATWALLMTQAKYKMYIVAEFWRRWHTITLWNKRMHNERH